MGRAFHALFHNIASHHVSPSCGIAAFKKPKRKTTRDRIIPVRRRPILFRPNQFDLIDFYSGGIHAARIESQCLDDALPTRILRNGEKIIMEPTVIDQRDANTRSF
jgi:hypothetical protein